MGCIIVAMPKLEDARKIGDMLWRKGVKVSLTCTLASEVLYEAQHAEEGIVICSVKLKDMGYYVYAAEADGVDYREVDYADKKVLVIGNEGKGISRLVLDNSDVIISIPMIGEVNSLNASVAAGILIYGMNR